MSKGAKYILTMIAMVFIVIPLSFGIAFGTGYLVGLGVEWGMGHDVVLGPLRLPTWIGIAFCVANMARSHGGSKS